MRTTTSRWRVYQFRHLGQLCEGKYTPEFVVVESLQLPLIMICIRIIGSWDHRAF